MKYYFLIDEIMILLIF